ncbi:MAG: phosphoenolpyruvate synthase [Spirochaetaceae bacterium]
MSSYIKSFNDSNKPNLLEVGGKAFNLIKLSKMKGIQVPEGFCISTEVYKKLFLEGDVFNSLLNQLSNLKLEDKDKIDSISSQIREVIGKVKIPEIIVDEIIGQLNQFSDNTSYAVRSSGTAEDLPTASFAGQYDTYLNIIGTESIIEHIIKCWASLFTKRAVIYRIQNGIDHLGVFLAVVIQRMILPQASGIMFTADPITGNRKVSLIDASYGIGEALVSGLVNPDTYKVKEGKIVDKKISTKNIAIYPINGGGIKESKIDDEHRNIQTLTDEQIIKLADIGRQFETYFASPQDIEWCLYDNEFYFVQSRSITTLYPLPKTNNGEKHIFLSTGHLQMMTAAIRPLGMYFFNSVIGSSPSQDIGGRLYADITHDLGTPMGRFITKSLIGVMGDVLITNAVSKIIKDKKLIKTLPKGKDKIFKSESSSGVWSIMLTAYKNFKKNDPEIIKDIIAKEDSLIEKMKSEIETLSGDKLFDFIYNDHLNRRKKVTKPPTSGTLTAVLLSEKWFSKKIEKWLGIKNAADTILMSIPNSISTETGYGLLDVADVIRDYPDVINYLKNPKDETFFEDISKLDGGETVNRSIKSYLSKFGMRCSGDIDITVPRWSEKPTEIVQIILSNINNFEPNASKHKYEQGLIESEKRIDEIATKVSNLPNGRRRAKKIRKIASLIRNYIGFREYPKFSYIKRYYIYKQALLKEAVLLLKKGLIRDFEDIYYLSFDELWEVVKTDKLDYDIIEKRIEQFKLYEKLTPPRIMTSEGEIISGEYNKVDIPKNALPGLAVSAGIIEGRARVISSFEEADLQDGDILVTKFTDPSWTPLFVSIKGFVTEVGGLITHGAIIAREYGLPAVVSVENATKLIKDGQMIRVNGTEGYIEFLS